MEILWVKPWKIAENRTLKWGSSPPPSRGGNLADHKRPHLQWISLPIRKMAVQIDSVAFCHDQAMHLHVVLRAAPIHPNCRFVHRNCSG
jgi:hypothetical protein